MGNVQSSYSSSQNTNKHKVIVFFLLLLFILYIHVCYHHHHLITSVVTSAAIFRKLTHVVIQLAQLSARTHTVVPNYKNPPKIKILKIREIDGSYLRLQRFDKFWMWSSSTRKWKLCKFAETCMEKLVKALWVNLFPAGFSHLEPLCNEGRGLTAV